MSFANSDQYNFIDGGVLSGQTHTDLGQPDFVLAFKLERPDVDKPGNVELTILRSSELEFRKVSAHGSDKPDGSLLPLPEDSTIHQKAELLQVIQPDGSVSLALNRGIWRWFP